MIAWFARNGVAANLLMMVIVVGGLVAIPTIKLELFPQFSLDTINVTVPYPGSAPEEVEEGICVRVEEAVQDLNGIKRLRSVAQEGIGVVSVEVDRGYETRRLTDEIKARVDAISTFPTEAEEPVVEELLIKKEVLSVAVIGDADEHTLRRLTAQVRDEIAALPGVTQVTEGGVRDYEIAVEVSEEVLRRHGLTFDDVARRVRTSSLDLPGGAIKSEGGTILVRSVGQAYTREDFEGIVLIARPDGTHLTLGEVARVDDGFEDDLLYTRFNGRPAAIVRVFEVGQQSPLAISEAVRDYVAEAGLRMPEGITLEVWRDVSFYLRGRLNMLLKNGAYGTLLVVAVLALFLRPSLAFWVMLGIPISFLGTFLLMPWVDVSINLISLFGFILVLGVVVDDAIVVGESVFTHYQRDGPGVESSIRGAEAVAVPVTFAVLTTAVAFLPLLKLPGIMGKFFIPIPLVVIPTLLFSLVESKLILPYHLSLARVGTGQRDRLNLFQRVQRAAADGLERVIERLYRPALRRALGRRYLTLAIFVAGFVLTLALVAGGWVKSLVFPPVPSDYIAVEVNLPDGAPVAATERALDVLNRALEEELRAITEEEGKRNPVLHVSITVGGQLYTEAGGPQGAGSAIYASNRGEFLVEMVKSELRDLSSIELSRRWRRRAGPMPEAREVVFRDTAGPGGIGSPVQVQLAAPEARFGEMREAADAIKAKLATYAGVFDVRDDYSGGKREIKLRIKPAAELLGLTQADLARQARQAFYGEEAQRIQRGRDDIRVMVRYPAEERRSIGHLERMRIRTPDGREIPFSEVAEVELGRGFPGIKRTDRKRTLTISANADKVAADVKKINQDLFGEFLPELMRRYPGVTWSMEGEAKEEAESMAELGRSFLLVLCIMYALMAVPFRSYLQPLIVMSVIPFGLIGAVFGHLLFGHPISQLSIFGIVALSGVVVNDSLVLVDYINRRRRSGEALAEAVWEAGAARFRPIILTSLTTFAGLTPVLFERSLQAQFLIPMAISLAFGVLFATVITLFLVPAIYLILEDLKPGERDA